MVGYMKRVLMVTAFPPNEKTAGQDYTRRLILDMLSKNYNVDLIYAYYPGHEIELPKEVNVLRVINPSISNCLKKCYVHPFFTKRYERKIKDYIQNIASNYDMLYFDFSQVHLYAKYIEHPYKILMCHDVICQKYARKTCKLNVEWIKKCEREVFKCAKTIFTFSNKDKKIIKDEYKIDAMPVNFYLKSDKFTYRNETLNHYMCFYGAWNRKENIESLQYFIKMVYPKLKNQGLFSIIGGGMPHKMVKNLERMGIDYLGFIDDPIKYLASCQALIVPLHQGAGVKVKVIDALTTGTPVIGTAIAFEGIEDNKNYNLFYQAEKDEQFVKIIDEWINIGTDFKQNAADEFYNRYNCNHFPEVIERLQG